jgi:hypothetical protein
MRLNETIKVDSNLRLVARERGKIVTTRDVHNIWLNFGSEWLAKRIAYTSFGPLTPEDSNGIRYMGLGIGGTRQTSLGVANATPLVEAYPGTNLQTDTDPTVLGLERPVRISGGTTAYPGEGADVWLGQIQAPPEHPTPSQVTFKRLFTITEVSYGPYLTVPVSEIGLFLHNDSPSYVNVYNNQPVAYDTFPAIPLTTAITLEASWTIRFGG